MVPRINDNIFDSWLPVKPEPHVGGVPMRTNVRETKDVYLIETELPGFSKEDVKLSLKDGRLTITAEKKSEEGKKNEDGKYIYKERHSFSGSRSFNVGSDVAKDDVKAAFKDGILTVTVPKKKEEEKKEENLIEIE